MTVHVSPWSLPIVPLVGALMVFAAPHARGRGAGRLHWAILPVVCVSVLLATLVLACWAAVQGGVGATSAWAGWGGGPRLSLLVSVTEFSRVMVVLVPTIAIPVVWYAGSSMREADGLPRLLALLVAFTGLMELLVSASDFLTLLIAWELVGACSWALIGYEWRDVRRVRAARDAFLTTRIGDLGLYIAAGALFASAGTLRFDALEALHGPALAIVAGGILLAAAAKSAQLPFSPWLFSAMEGPTAASALLHSAAMVAAGAYLLIRLSPLFASVHWFAPAVAVLGASTALAGGIVAAAQSDLKKALAASTSAQYGLMFVAIGAGFSGAAGMHLVTHAAFKALLFLGAGVVMHAANTLDLETINRQHLRRTLPRASWLVGIGLLALAAIPPLGGAFSKEAIVAAAARAGAWSIPLTIGVLVAGMLSAFYASRLQLLIFGVPRRVDGDRPATDQRPPSAELSSLVLLAALTVALGVLWIPGTEDFVRRAAGGRVAESALWEFAASLATVGVGLGWSWLLWRRGNLAAAGLGERLRQRLAGWLGLPTLARRTIVAPACALSTALASFDDRVVDVGIRGAVRLASLASNALAWWEQAGLARTVSAIASAATGLAGLSRMADDRGVDATVEGIARGIGIAGAESRRLQSGLTHDYYAFIAGGTIVLIAIATTAVLVHRLP